MENKFILRSELIRQAEESGIYDYNTFVSHFVKENPDIEIINDLK